MYNIVITINYLRKLVAVQAYHTEKSPIYKHTVTEAYKFMEYKSSKGPDAFPMMRTDKVKAMKKYPSHEWDVFVADVVKDDEKLSRITVYNRLFDAAGFTLFTHKNRK